MALQNAPARQSSMRKALTITSAQTGGSHSWSGERRTIVRNLLRYAFNSRSPETAGEEARDKVGKREAKRNPYAKLAPNHFTH